MHRFPFNVVETLLISALLVVCFHILPWNQTRQRTNLLKDPAHLSTGTYPSWATSEQQAYLASLRDDSQQAIDVRKQIASGSVENQYNLGTYLALHSVTSGEVTDLKRLQEAEQYLSGATDLQTSNAELEHNLRTVRELLSEEQEKTAGGEEQQPEQENSEQQPPSGSENQNQQNQQQGGEQQQAELSESMKQQLEQYQQQLLAEQAQNQQFFDKRPLELGQNDPFAGLNQLFGGDPQFDQQTDSGTKDW